MIESTSSVMKPGDIYGRYTVLGIFKEDSGYQKFARVQCECGSPVRYVQIGVLRNGTSKSCGCLHKERVTKHGAWGTPLFNVWRGMISRCTNQSDKRYSRYGGRGISVCARWLDVNNFITDMQAGYKPHLQIDRVDNNGNYCPENCRWASSKQQTRNYGRNIVLEHEGKKLCLADWAIETGINYGTLWTRVQAGWTTKRLLSTPAKR